MILGLAGGRLTLSGRFVVRFRMALPSAGDLACSSGFTGCGVRCLHIYYLWGNRCGVGGLEVVLMSWAATVVTETCRNDGQVRDKVMIDLSSRPADGSLLPECF